MEFSFDPYSRSDYTDHYNQELLLHLHIHQRTIIIRHNLSFLYLLSLKQSVAPVPNLPLSQGPDGYTAVWDELIRDRRNNRLQATTMT